MKIVKDGTAVGSGILLYKYLDKNYDPTTPMPWQAQLPQLELSNTVGFIDFLVASVFGKKLVKSAAAKEWLYAHGIAAGLSALIGLVYTPAMYVVSGPPYIPGVTSPSVGEFRGMPYATSEARTSVAGAF